jgi:undecaprenyl-diphosphatase
VGSEALKYVFLGAVQGLTEFLPISSSAHLVIFPWLFHWSDPGLAFDMALHLGTAVAILAYFWRDWVDLIRRWRQPLLWLILLACVPAALAGFKFEELFETVFRDPRIIALFMIVFGFVLWGAERYGRKAREIGSLNLIDAIAIGVAQVLALMPGVSRSGITMTAGLYAGLNRTAAARFSFLLSTPVIFGAALFKLRHVASLPHAELGHFLIGFLVSALVGVLTIKYLMQYLQKHSFQIFVWYRFAFGALVLLLWFVR